jgi:hypothetical protein
MFVLSEQALQRRARLCLQCVESHPLRHTSKTPTNYHVLSGTARHYSVTLCAVNQLSKMEMLLGSIKVNLIPIPLPLSE